MSQSWEWEPGSAPDTSCHHCAEGPWCRGSRALLCNLVFLPIRAPVLFLGWHCLCIRNLLSLFLKAWGPHHSTGTPACMTFCRFLQTDVSPCWSMSYSLTQMGLQEAVSLTCGSGKAEVLKPRYLSPNHQRPRRMLAPWQVLSQEYRVSPQNGPRSKCDQIWSSWHSIERRGRERPSGQPWALPFLNRRALK